MRGHIIGLIASRKHLRQASYLHSDQLKANEVGVR